MELVSRITWLQPLRRPCRPSEELPVTPRRLHNARDCAVKRRLILPPAQPKREGEIAGTDKDDVDTRRRGNRVDLIERRGLFDHTDRHNLLISRVVIVVRVRPRADRRPGSGAPFAGRGIPAGGGSSRSLLACAGKRENHAAYSLVEDAL